MGKILGFFGTVIICAILFFVGIDTRVAGNPLEVYQVYLNGEKIGLINSQDKLFKLIDEAQADIKKKYNVDKVYPPAGLDIQRVYTYDDNIVDENVIYEKIKDIEPFTIEGYVVTIKYTEPKIINEVEYPPHDPVKINILDKKYIEEALYNTATAFIGTQDLEDYENKTQTEITDTGEIINSVYFEETITVKKAYISTNEQIFNNTEDLSRYLLFGTLENQKTYITHEGENLQTIADNNNLNIEELLIANPQFLNANALLATGEKINVGLINPLVNVVYWKTVVEDVKIAYKVETVTDKTKYTSYRVVTTKGQDGIRRVTHNIKYVNGTIYLLETVKKEVLVPEVNEVVTKGSKLSGGGFLQYSKYEPIGEYTWPTNEPFKIVSRFEWRSGEFHRGIDIAGVGYGSPVYAVADGVVYKVNYNKNKNEGLSVYIEHANGLVTQYMHMSKFIVKVGQQIKRGERIGYVGSTGQSTGPHLHLGVWQGYPYIGGTVIDPCKSIFKC